MIRAKLSRKPEGSNLEDIDSTLKMSRGALGACQRNLDTRHRRDYGKCLRMLGT